MKKSNIKRTVLHCLMLVSLIASPVPMQAESKTYNAKKIAKVAWHLSKVATAIILGIVVSKEPFDLVRVFKTGKCTSYHTEDRILLSAMTLGSVVLFIDGLSGLNQEFEIIDHIKHLRDKKSAGSNKENGIK